MVVPLGPGKFYGRSLPRPRIYNDVKFNDVRVDPPISVVDPFLSWAEEAHWSMGGLNYKRFRLQGRIEGNISKLRAQQEKVIKKKQMSRDSSANGGLNSDPFAFECEVPSGSKRAASDSPPPAPVATKRRRYMAVTEDSDSDDDIDSADEGMSGEAGKQVARRRVVKKLGDEFDKVASENEQSVGSVKGGPSQKGSGSVASRTRGRQYEQELHVDKDANDVVMKEVIKSISKGKGKKLFKVEGVNLSKRDGEKSPGALKTRSSPRLAKRNGSS